MNSSGPAPETSCMAANGRRWEPSITPSSDRKSDVWLFRSVTNPAPTTLTAQSETDEQLRTRARNFLHGSERATLGAIHHAIVRSEERRVALPICDQSGADHAYGAERNG